MGSPPTVFVVDDDVRICDTLRRLTQSVGLHSAAYVDAQAFLHDVTPDHPGCVVLDVRLPKTNGLQVQRELITRKIPLPVIMTTGYADVAMAVEAMKAGAFDFIEKPFTSRRMLEAIQCALERDVRNRAALARQEVIRRRLAQLSHREMQVLRLVAEGLASTEVASELGIRTKTVEVYRSHINKKMMARNAADLVRMLHELGEQDETRPPPAETPGSIPSDQPPIGGNLRYRSPFN